MSELLDCIHLLHFTTSDNLRFICPFLSDCSWPQLTIFSSEQTVLFPSMTSALTPHQGSARLSCHRSVVKLCEKKKKESGSRLVCREARAAQFVSIAGCTDLGTATWMNCGALAAFELQHFIRQDNYFWPVVASPRLGENWELETWG